MANTYSSLFYHIIFSTKNRTAFIRPEIEARVWAYIGGIARKHKMTAIQVGGVNDYIHTLVLTPPILAPVEIAKYLKRDSWGESPRESPVTAVRGVTLTL